MSEWNFQSLSGQCALTEHSFAEGEAIWSALFALDDQIVRVDLCESAWDARQKAIESGEPAEAICVERLGENESTERIVLQGEPIHYWRHVKPPADEKPRQRYVDDDVLFEFFKKLGGSGDEKHLAFRYVLALHLIRRKRLVFADVVRQGEEDHLILGERKNESVTYKVLDPSLDEAQVLALREQMDRVLEMEDLDAQIESPAES